MAENERHQGQTGDQSLRHWVATLTHDWRVRTLLPVLFIHLLAFSALFAFIYHTATRGVVSDYQQIATGLLHEVEEYFADAMRTHSGQAVLRFFHAVGIIKGSA